LRKSTNVMKRYGITERKSSLVNCTCI
jgi:hypothetical protein